MSMIQFHILRNYASSNLNRDEIGAPKTAIFAGSQRGRISSQCLKRAWRNSDVFKSLNSFGIRTKYLPELVIEQIEKIADTATLNFANKNKNAFSNLGKSGRTVEKAQKKDDTEAKEDAFAQTKQLMFFSKQDIDACVQAILNAEQDAKKLSEEVKNLEKNATIRPITLDIALFGRMITDNKFADVEASLQVAHALSTNRVNQESDYFTAVDDLGAKYREDAGAGHLGDCDFNSCCYYEYAALDVDQLKRNLQFSDDAKEKIPYLINTLLQAMVYTSPSGKQNSFAAHSLPSIVCLEKKDKKIPVSYINAFEEPVSYNYSIESAKRLANEIDKTDSKFDTAITKRLWFDINDSCSPSNAEVTASIDKMLEKAADWLQ